MIIIHLQVEVYCGYQPFTNLLQHPSSNVTRSALTGNKTLRVKRYTEKHHFVSKFL